MKVPDLNLQLIKAKYGIVGMDPRFNTCLEQSVKVARADVSVLITGESGVGKESFPKIIHQYSPRKHQPYFSINCGAIPEGTIDSELFGHEKGSFTGALSKREGYFESCDGGVLFLDEIGELPIASQAKLLRVLENGEYIRVGGSQVRKTDVRVIAATNINIEKAIKSNRFREDLYYRLGTVRLKIPALRERGEDILFLFKKFALDFSEKYRVPKVELLPDAEDVLLNYPWPGNIRQLKNITDQLSLLEMDRKIRAERFLSYLDSSAQKKDVYKIPNIHQNDENASDLKMIYKMLLDVKRDIHDLKRIVMQNGNTMDSNPNAFINHPPPEKHLSLPSPSPIIPSEPKEVNLSLETIERKTIESSLKKNNYKRKEAAIELGISERTLYRKIKDYGL